MSNWVDPRNPKGRRRKTTNVGEGKEFHVKKGESLKEEGYPHSTSPSSNPTGKAQPATRNYLNEGLMQYTGGDPSKLKATNMTGRRILAVAQGKGQWSKEKAMAERKAAAQAKQKDSTQATLKKAFDKQQVMADRRAAAQAAGKGNWNAQDEMKKRREAAQAQGKGSWNAQEEMEKRRKASQMKKQNNYDISAPKKR